MRSGKKSSSIAGFDFDEVRRNRAAFGFFRDRRPELYGILAEK